MLPILMGVVASPSCDVTEGVHVIGEAFRLPFMKIQKVHTFEDFADSFGGYFFVGHGSFFASSMRIFKYSLTFSCVQA